MVAPRPHPTRVSVPEKLQRFRTWLLRVPVSDSNRGITLEKLSFQIDMPLNIICPTPRRGDCTASIEMQWNRDVNFPSAHDLAQRKDLNPVPAENRIMEVSGNLVYQLDNIGNEANDLVSGNVRVHNIREDLNFMTDKVSQMSPSPFFHPSPTQRVPQDLDELRSKLLYSSLK
jgi:hypothetical protein